MRSIKKDTICNPEKLMFLTQDYAEQRASIVKSKTVIYQLNLTLREGAYFQGVVDITFELRSIENNDLFIDYSGKSITNLKINDTKVQLIEWNGHFLKLQRKYLIENSSNIIQIEFHNAYSNNGCGLHSYTDSHDNQQYIYSQCEAYYCNMIFPNFDQPDIKAKLLLTVSIPQKWIFIANESPNNYKKHDQISCIEFKPTPWMSTYLFAFIAGPYYQISQDKQEEIPMCLFSRQSNKNILEKQKDFIFEVTKKGIHFYESFFQHKYPFSKYDQIFCPEFNSGAMENIGAVTFTDEYLFQDEVDQEKWGRFANTILHELAHMWFGNLVTMKWWNDLWLNESFADFISHFCLSKISINGYETLQDNSWIQFNMRKSWGYREDQLVTTHPIAGDVPNTDVARSIFDGITYAKGAATIKQLLFVVGENLFSNSLALYFDKFKYSNATLKDFIGALNSTYLRFSSEKFDFESWQRQWVKSAGLNVCEALFDPKSCQEQIRIEQSSALQSHNTLRNHKMKIVFFDDKGNMDEQIIQVLAQQQTIITYKINFPISAIMLNYEDHSFVKVIIDRFSFAFFQNHLHLIQNDLTRTLIWRSIYDMVRDARLSSEEYLEFFQKAIVNENKESIIISQFQFVRIALKSFTPPQFLGPISESMRQFTKQFIQKRPSSKNLVLGLKPYLSLLAESDESILQLKEELVSGSQNKQQIRPKESTVVTLIHSSPQFTREQKRKLYEKYILTSPNYQRISQKCLVLDYTLQECEILWNTFVSSSKNKSLQVQANIMSGFNINNQYPQFTQQWLTTLPQVFKHSSKEYASLFYDQLFPKDQDIVSIQKELQFLLSSIEKEIKANSQEGPYLLLKKLRQSLDDLQRKQSAYSKFMESKIKQTQISAL